MFPRESRYLERVKANYLEYAEEMFAQVGNFRPVPWADTLLQVATSFQTAGIHGGYPGAVPPRLGALPCTLTMWTS